MSEPVECPCYVRVGYFETVAIDIDTQCPQGSEWPLSSFEVLREGPNKVTGFKVEFTIPSDELVEFAIVVGTLWESRALSRWDLPGNVVILGKKE